jgi:hypothetical protein
MLKKIAKLVLTIFAIGYLGCYLLYKSIRKPKTIDPYQRMLDGEEVWVKIGDGRAMIVNNCSLMDC